MKPICFSRTLRTFALSAALAAPVLWAQAQTLTVVMQGGLRVMDPITSTAFLTRDHGYMIYDTLLGTDAHFKIQPQMADWKASADGLRYRFTLRSGLKWHDGAPVTSADCIASIKRWAEVDSSGQVLLPMIDSIEAVDDKVFEVVLKERTTLLLEGLAKLSSRPAFMMPKRIADTAAATPLTEYTGSGPFRLVRAEFKPGLKVVYEKNKDYVARSEPASWTAGAKLVGVERVEWIAMPDAMTSINALKNGEVDFIQQVPYDLVPMLEHQKNVTVQVLDKLGSWTYFRFNHLHPPFDNKLVRQAAMAAVGQEDVLKALVGNPKFYRTCAAVFGCGHPNGSSYGAEWVIPSDIDKAKALLKEGRYDGMAIVVLQPTDVAIVAAQPIVIGAALRKAGFKVQMKTMDWQTVVTQQGNQKSPQEGGWNIFATAGLLATSGDPMTNTTVGSNGRKAWAGWPDVPAIEVLRQRYVRSTDLAERKSIAVELQKLVIDNGVVAPLGQFLIPAAYSTAISGVLESPVTVFWNIKKSAK
ncbi:ABC transporter substrate-binding protein [Verminephrobacter eiseniae]|uniref:ABC transporter substrate-binding protein n=1 Tax=Verminephrobacter eiseniae TaxID=364317 RepID=UPI0010D5E452|nr:ABC transporter substrate-binding protein [Verminephrobacter eiseniae]KAB7598128.1 ABC transporter substrate-binding protein [Verminephrobacter sp. Larva24]MCW5229816.1 ABC transporter substrate-binding protein [Verminephrobacter eiseniae]MCW5291547.1 ABC transporter substrate-binding protein [Verminephrobacter eiseniae]MCW8186448.1 ABC transporter substrate-binding protein [Verminephrobacter eiseniae]MCW8222878.1 ABC transporter substrate-binding protein [Verminephrobacter eiseniae]